MKHRIDPRMIVAVLICVAGVAVAYRGLARPGTPLAVDGAAFDPVGLIPLADIDLDARFRDEVSAERIFQQIKDSIVDSFSRDDALRGAVDITRQDLLAEEFVSNLRLSMYGSCDEWIARVVESGATPNHSYFGRLGEGVSRERFCELWELAASRARGARVASRQAYVRPRLIAGREFGWEMPPQYTATRFQRVHDPMPKGSIAVECLLPMEIRLGENDTPDWVVQLAVHFLWVDAESRWVPMDLVLYSSRSRSGTFIVPPL